jgi:DNA-binding response OmpR family regulator
MYKVKPIAASLSAAFCLLFGESELYSMNIHQILFLCDNCDATASWLASLHQLQKAYSITIARRQPISIYAAANFDLIIIEAETGTRLDVLETCHRLRARTNAPILFVSSIDDEAYALEAYEVGANEYIVKPISTQILHAKLEAWNRWIVPAKSHSLLPVHEVVKVI